MNSKDIGEDGAFLLYLSPVVVSIVYGAVEWFQIGRTQHSMPALAYVIVSKSPYLLVFAIAAVCAAVVLEVRNTDPAGRPGIINANASRMQILAVVVIIVSYAAALSAAGYGDIGTAFGYFLNGRAALIYGLFLLGTSVLLSPSQLIGKVSTAVVAELIGALLIGLSPAVLYGANRVHLSLSYSALAGAVVFALGVYILLASMKMVGRTKSSATPVALQQSA